MLGVSAVLLDPEGAERQRIRLAPPRGERGMGTDRWEGILTPSGTGNWSFVIEAWHDRYGTWHHNAEVKIAAGIDVELMLAEGSALLAEASDDDSRSEEDRGTFRWAAARLADASLGTEERLAAGFGPEVSGAVARQPIRELVTVSLDLAALDLDPQDRTPGGGFYVDDLISGESWEWAEYNYVRLDPHVEPAHILSVRRNHQ